MNDFARYVLITYMAKIIIFDTLDMIIVNGISKVKCIFDNSVYMNSTGRYDALPPYVSNGWKQKSYNTIADILADYPEVMI